MEGYHIDKDKLKSRMTELIKLELIPDLKSANEVQIYKALATALKEQFIDAWNGTREKCQEQDLKRVYYLSMEFLMGRALGNNLINLGAVKEVREILDELGVDLNCIEDQERDWALGNGGLGRLAA